MDLSKMTRAELENYVSKMTSDELYKCIRSNDTDTRLMREIATGVTYYCDVFFELLSTINLPPINELLEDSSISPKFLECVADTLYSSADDSICLVPLKKVFEHPSTTQEMLRKACDRGFETYVIDKLNINDPLNREKLKEIKNNSNVDEDIRIRAYQRLKEDSSVKKKLAVVIIQMDSLMQDFIMYRDMSNKSLSDCKITGELLQKLSLLYDEMTRFRKQIGAEKLIFIPIVSKVYDHDRSALESLAYTGPHTWFPGDPDETMREKRNADISPIYGSSVNAAILLSKDYVLFDKNLEFCNWFYSCIAKIIAGDYPDNKGNGNIVFDTGFYSDGYINVERLNEGGSFNITKNYIRENFMRYGMRDRIVSYIDKLTMDYVVPVVIVETIDDNISTFQLGLIERLKDTEIFPSTIKPENDFQLPVTDSEVSDGDNSSIKIFPDGTFSVSVAENGYEGIIQCFQCYLNYVKNPDKTQGKTFRKIPQNN